MFPCPHCRSFTCSLLQGAVGPEYLHCRYCGSSVLRASYAKPVGLILMVVIAFSSLVSSIAWNSPVPLCGLSLSLVAGRAYWPFSAHVQLSWSWLVLVVAVLALASLGGVL